MIDELEKLHIAMAMEFNRAGLSINLEPDAFYRLSAELMKRELTDPIPCEEFFNKELVLYTPVGILKVVKDESLGKNSYIKVRI